ncbi:S-adenosyl-L-methionine-dependent methyltransferases superfamily protein [Rhynchospora pubera]|uniref:S-adenosyl-L-methionine-dependent methyltransferases superfamily protein n=1 Tax=Rhynchospora pubera TaxID=906938 RepID=A0AAV8DA33_9POAL|nr:S-adenosyl-L-methionine-dependent methyltransferases superfamily protein [Rhynchospora pubera]
MGYYCSSLRPFSHLLMETLTLPPFSCRRIGSRHGHSFFRCSPSRLISWRAENTMSGLGNLGAQSAQKPILPEISGVEEALMGFISGTRKATEVAQAVWKKIVWKGDTVIDATCGNGHDTLALVKLVADKSGKGRVYGIDIQQSAIDSTFSLLEMSADEHERKLVQLFEVCHSKMEEIVPKENPVRLVAFNLGYLPGGDKTLITMPHTTEMALRAASKILDSKGLISIIVYVGHPGGSNELEIVEAFASSLPAETWVGCKFEMLNRPTAPILVLLFKK